MPLLGATQWKEDCKSPAANSRTGFGRHDGSSARGRIRIVRLTAGPIN